MFKKLKSKTIIILVLLTIAVSLGAWGIHTYANRDKPTTFVSKFGYSFKVPKGYVVKDEFAEESDGGFAWARTKVYLNNTDQMPFVEIAGPIIDINTEQLEKIRLGPSYYRSGQDASDYVYDYDWKYPPVFVETTEGLFAIDLVSRSIFGQFRTALFNEDYIATMRTIISTLDSKSGTQETAGLPGYILPAYFYEYRSGLVTQQVYLPEL